MVENKIQWLLPNQKRKCMTDERGLAPSPLLVGHIPAEQITKTQPFKKKEREGLRLHLGVVGNATVQFNTETEIDGWIDIRV